MEKQSKQVYADYSKLKYILFPYVNIYMDGIHGISYNGFKRRPTFAELID